MPDITLDPRADDDWSEEDDDALPGWLAVLTAPTLDRDEATARVTADLFLAVERRCIDELCELEDMDRALAVSEPVSERARTARTRVRRAIDGFNDVIGGTSQARDALVHHWR